MKSIIILLWTVATAPIAFMALKMKQHYCDHSKLMYKGNNVYCTHCGSQVF